MINKILLILLMTNIAFADKESDTVNIIQLTKEEIEYIKEKKVINICLGNDQIPITIKQNNKYRGIAIDFLKIIAKVFKCVSGIFLLCAILCPNAVSL